ncbi:AAAS [Cordylochernes scorpioides]|uniref:AAAS n=1 Tax=Cordylochernes scorpioides TaxID=51811 RepID=A0ABY6JV63_9ARAC|nr:AAAS [Cordylochernes scorpioides]
MERQDNHRHEAMTLKSSVNLPSGEVRCCLWGQMSGLEVFLAPPTREEQTQAEISSHLVTELPHNLAPLIEYENPYCAIIIPTAMIIMPLYFQSDDNGFNLCRRHRGFEGVVEELSLTENEDMGKWTRIFHKSLTFSRKTVLALQNLLIRNPLEHCTSPGEPAPAECCAACMDSGVLIWNISPKSLATRPASSNLSWLRHEGKVPVTAIEWHPQGLYLVSASAFDNSIHIWDLGTEQPVVLTRYGSGGTSLLSFSLDGSKLLTATTSSLFLVWDTEQWESTSYWTEANNCIRTALWGPNDSLFYICDKSPVLYQLTPENVLTVISLEPACLPCPSGSNVWIGGQVLNMVWNKNRERLAIAFKEHPELVAVFYTCYDGNTFTTVPCGLITGPQGEKVQHMAFNNDFQRGALLTITNAPKYHVSDVLLLYGTQVLMQHMTGTKQEGQAPVLSSQENNSL